MNDTAGHLTACFAASDAAGIECQVTVDACLRAKTITARL